MFFLNRVFLGCIFAVITPAVFAQSGQKIFLNQIAEGLESPVLLTALQHDSRLFVVQQNGVISIVEAGSIRDVLDLRAQTTFGNEAGMLGLALHPDFLENGLAYVSYTSSNFIGRNFTSIIEEYHYNVVSGVFENASAREIYRLAQPARNHNGGMIAFGPDGYLYAGFGDGGGGGDRYGNGQNFNSALGSIIRIAVGPDVAEPFGIPADNPQIDGPAPEVWIYGMRNPWRFSFDGDYLYIGDVGQGTREEIDVINSGAASSGDNLGWPLAEGNLCFDDPACKSRDIIWPVVTYATADGCAVTGGYVYRGSAMPALVGHYFYGDFCTGEIFSFKYENGVLSDQRAWAETLGTVDSLSGFGRDGFGEIYVISLNGTIYRLETDD
ncbi:MAG: PQQ-dependent sugar dehydrogenase [Rhodobacteraceae bacterium]|nr:PQQ-dependent sugar dehydrogenase [Paracoccaceae bacterium]